MLISSSWRTFSAVNGQGRPDPTRVLLCPCDHARHDPRILRVDGRIERNLCQLPDPLQIGARDMASPFLNMLSYWFFLMASIVMLSSLFIATGPASGGWTSYPPLSALGDASEGSKTGWTLDHFHGLVCRLFPVRWSKLYLHDP